VPPQNTAYGIFLNDPRFPSDGTLPDQKNQWQPRLGFAWDIRMKANQCCAQARASTTRGKTCCRKSDPITTNGVQQQTIFLNTPIIASGVPGPVWPNVVAPPSTVTPCVSGGVSNPFRVSAACACLVAITENPRIYNFNVGFEQEIAQHWSLFLDFTHTKAVHLTRFLNVNRNNFFAPFLGETMVTSSVGKSVYDGFTVGMRKRFSGRYQLEWNYTYAKDKDDDSNERDPFTDRAFDINNLQLDYAYSDRDIRHKFNLFTFIELGWGLRETSAYRDGRRSRSRRARERRPIETSIAKTTSTSRLTGEFSVRSS
jgi:hypothetical protein